MLFSSHFTSLCVSLAKIHHCTKKRDQAEGDLKAYDQFVIPGLYIFKVSARYQAVHRVGVGQCVVLLLHGVLQSILELAVFADRFNIPMKVRIITCNCFETVVTGVAGHRHTVQDCFLEGCVNRIHNEVLTYEASEPELAVKNVLDQTCMRVVGVAADAVVGGHDAEAL